jgi:Leucine-rich repeat (LRR) protein
MKNKPEETATSESTPSGTPGVTNKRDKLVANAADASKATDGRTSRQQAANLDSSHPYIQHQTLAQQLSPERWSMLDLGGMSIRSIGASLSLYTTYSFLTALYINHNKLSSLPSSIGELTNLVILDISVNQIRLLPTEIGHCRQLREMWAFDNLLETLPWEMAWLRALEFIGLEYVTRTSDARI